MRRFYIALIGFLAAAPAWADVSANISNAPIWATSTAYTAPVAPARWGSRVNSGPGTIGGTYTSGSAVYVWEALNDGTSKSSGNGPQTCTTPGTTTYTEDTGLQWKCLGIVDYVTFSSWAFGGPAYSSPTTYHWHDYITSNGNVYRADQASGNDCTSGGTAPTGTTFAQTDNTCVWDYAVSVPYWSGNNGPIPYQRYLSGGGANGTPTDQMTVNYTGNFFHGGVGKPSYLAGSGNEAHVFVLQAHQDFTADLGASDESSLIGWVDGGPYIEVKAASVDQPVSSGSAQPLAYDETQFVSFHNNANVAGSSWNTSIPIGAANSIRANTGIVQEDVNVRFTGFAVKSDNGDGVDGNRPNAMVATNMLVDANFHVGWYVDASSLFTNVVVINRSNITGAVGLAYSYASAYDNLTVYFPNPGTNSTCIAGNNTNNQGSFGSTGTSIHLANSMLFGCENVYAINTAKVANFVPGANQISNATDHVNSSSSPTFTFPYLNESYTGVAPPGMSASACGGPCYGLTFSNVFVSTSDLREKSTSPTIGVGSAYSFAGGSPFPTVTNATDLFGNARPSYDIGAANQVTTIYSMKLHFPCGYPFPSPGTTCTGGGTDLTFTDDPAASAGVPTVGGAVKDMGDYQGPSALGASAVCQHHRSVISADGNWTITFAPDCAGGRVEFWVYFGKQEVPGTTAAYNHIDPITATFFNGATQIGTVTYAGQMWGQMWRWTNAPASGTWASRPVVRTPSQISAAHLMLPFGDATMQGGFLSAYNGPSDLGVPDTYAGPTDSGPTSTDMGAAGERNDIGVVPEQCASWMVFNTAVALKSCLAGAESFGSIPYNNFDQGANAIDNTGAVLDVSHAPVNQWPRGGNGTQFNQDLTFTAGPAAFHVPTSLRSPPLSGTVTSVSGSTLTFSTLPPGLIACAIGSGAPYCPAPYAWDFTHTGAITSGTRKIVSVDAGTGIVTMDGDVSAVTPGDLIQFSRGIYWTLLPSSAAPPSAPSLTHTNTGLTWVQIATAVNKAITVGISYVDATGHETTLSAATQDLITAGTGNNNWTITSPSCPGGIVGYNVYVGSGLTGILTFTDSNGPINLYGESQQNTTPIPCGTDFPLPVQGPVRWWDALGHINHMPTSPPIAYFATDDPYYLMLAQQRANEVPMFETGLSGYQTFTGVTTPPYYTGLISSDEARALAWAITGYAQARLGSALPASLPTWLASPSLFDQYLSDEKHYTDLYMSSTATVFTRFHPIARSDSTQYMANYLNFTLGHMKYSEASGFAGTAISNYDTFYQWVLDGTTFMSDTTRNGSGCASFPARQEMILVNHTAYPTATDTLYPAYSGAYDSVTNADWATVIAETVLHFGWTHDNEWGNTINFSPPTCGNYIYLLQSGGDMYYTAWGAVRLGKLNGMLRVDDSLAFLNANMPAFMGTHSGSCPAGYATACTGGYGNSGGGVAAKWSIADSVGACTINSVSLDNASFTGGSTSGTAVGTMSASLSGSCSGSATWTITSTGSDHASTACNAASGTDFQAVGTQLELNATLGNGTYSNICYTATLAGAVGSPYTQAVTITGSSASCTINSVSLNNSTFPGGSTIGTVVGAMSHSTSGTCASPTWSITSTGLDHSSIACNNSSGTDFQAVGSNLELNTTLAAGTYVNICYTDTISGAIGSPFVQAVTLTGTGGVLTGGGRMRRR